MHALAEARDQSDAAVSSHAASVAATERSLLSPLASLEEAEEVEDNSVQHEKSSSERPDGYTKLQC